MSRSLLAVLMAMSLGACTKQGFLTAPEADPEVAGKVGSFSTETHFLLEPTSEGEELLGRAVHVSKSGGWTIADERAPGCQVRVKRSQAEYEKSYRIGLGDMTAMSGGYSDLLKLEARYGRSVEAAMKIQNLETLTADTEGPCGEVIVKSVRVGTGERRLVRKAEASAKGRAGNGALAVGGGREAATDVADEMTWSSPQAYAFTYEQSAQRKVFDFQASLNEKVADGEEIEIRFTASQDAFLVIYFLEESGAGTVLYPSSAMPVVQVKAGERVLVNGAGGGVGTFAVQIARALGCHVTAVGSTAKRDLLLGLGADVVLDYTREDPLAARGAYDVIVDCVGNIGVFASRRLLRPGGRHVAIASNPKVMLRALVSKLLPGKPYRSMYVVPSGSEVAAFAGWFERGQMRVVLDRTYPLAQIAEAQAYVERGRSAGKVAITIGA